jgi:outer membrane receptor protein involved in Fe transport
VASNVISELNVPKADGNTGADLRISPLVYADLTAGYSFPTKTRVQLGIINIANRQPPLIYGNNTINANTDVSTYDTIGRRYFASVVQKF